MWSTCICVNPAFLQQSVSLSKKKRGRAWENQCRTTVHMETWNFFTYWCAKGVLLNCDHINQTTSIMDYTNCHLVISIYFHDLDKYLKGISLFCLRLPPLSLVTRPQRTWTRSPEPDALQSTCISKEKRRPNMKHLETNFLRSLKLSNVNTLVNYHCI